MLRTTIAWSSGWDRSEPVSWIANAAATACRAERSRPVSQKTYAVSSRRRRYARRIAGVNSASIASPTIRAWRCSRGSLVTSRLLSAARISRPYLLTSS